MSDENDDKRDDAPDFGGDIKPIAITDEMKKSYLDYAMSVIVSRALPDVRDGMKPVHRRILYSMWENNHTPDRKHVKSANIVGAVMGQYHPHGDQAIYDALVRMAQPFSMRLPLVDGQGNFGSIDGDPPAAMRYTESRLDKSAMPLLDDLDRDTVDFQPNYDDSRSEPSVLPAKYPQLLVNGAGGIAVGMATNIPPHNLGEVIDACVAYIDDPEISIEDLNEIIPGPDFPTAGQIMGRSGIRSAYQTGRGSIVMRAKTHIEELRKERGLDEFGNYRYFSQWFSSLYVQSGYTGRSASLSVAGLLIGGLFAALTFWVSGSLFAPILILVLLAPSAPLLFLMFRRSRRQKTFGAQLPECLDVVVRSLRAGHPSPVAIALVAREMPDPIGTEFGMVSDEMTYGLPLAEGVTNMMNRVGLEDLRLLVIAISIQATTGGNLSDILANLSKVIRERAMLRSKIKALSGEGRMSAIVLSVFPFLLAGVISLMAPDYYTSVADSPIVRYGIGAALVLMAIGDYIMYRMVNFEI